MIRFQQNSSSVACLLPRPIQSGRSTAFKILISIQINKKLKRNNDDALIFNGCPTFTTTFRAKQNCSRTDAMVKKVLWLLELHIVLQAFELGFFFKRVLLNDIRLFKVGCTMSFMKRNVKSYKKIPCD